jgi:hypothetical protein
MLTDWATGVAFDVRDAASPELAGGFELVCAFETIALHCLPVALQSPPAAGTGTIIRTPVLRGYAEEAGFADVEVLPVDNILWRFYRLVG